MERRVYLLEHSIQNLQSTVDTQIKRIDYLTDRVASIEGSESRYPVLPPASIPPLKPPPSATNNIAPKGRKRRQSTSSHQNSKRSKSFGGSKVLDLVEYKAPPPIDGPQVDCRSPQSYDTPHVTSLPSDLYESHPKYSPAPTLPPLLLLAPTLPPSQAAFEI